MKKSFFIFLIIVLSISGFAQNTVNILKSDLSALNLPVASVDSLKFGSANSQLNIYTHDSALISIPVSTIDSMTFTTGMATTLAGVSTLQASSVSYTSASAGYKIFSVGGSAIIEKGICWSTNPNPTINDNKIVSIANTATSTVNLTGLAAGTTIHIKAFATNANGTAYGNDLQITTLSYTLPTVETTSASYDYSLNKATCVVNIKTNGGCTLTERGVCWSTTTNPTINDLKYSGGISTGKFYAFMTNLNLNSTYYVRAYATNCIGTAYGAQLTVKPMMGNVTYTLGIDSVANPIPYKLIKIAMDSACIYFDRYTPFKGNISVYYNAGIPTAQASYHGSIGFGPNTWYMWVGTAMHEMCHFMGSGTTSIWQSKVVNGIWTGSVASNLLKSLTGQVLNADTQHFWPFGINQRTEITNLGDTSAQQVGLSNCAKLCKAMCVDDCGLPTSW